MSQRSDGDLANAELNEAAGGTAARHSLVDSLRAAGEVGRDLLKVEWANTPLGEPESWPSSLTTTVRMLVSSRFSMWMAWGPELTFFCNEAYRRDTLGKKYPWALGRPASEVWAEIWPDIGPRIHTVLSTGSATWDESLLLFLERSGFQEETYHTFSYSPLTDDGGAIAGMLCVVTEDTERVIGERRMATLRELGAESTAGRDDRTYLEAAARCLGQNGRSLPFTLIYLFDESGQRAELAASTGTPPNHPAAPAVIAAGDSGAVWPLDAVLEGRIATIDDLDERPTGLPSGSWEEPPQTAVLLPLHQPVPGARPYGFLVVGANRYRPLDDTYKSFLGLLAAQLASGVASARAHETERRLAEAAVAASTAAREAAEREHQISNALQRSLLPPDEFESDHLEVATYYQAGAAGTQVGGDWYEAIELGAGRTALVIGDVAGRGIRAATVMGQLRAAVRAYAQLDLPPAEVLELLDSMVCQLTPGQLATCIYGVYDPVTREFRFANAGHLPPLVASPGQAVERLPIATAPPLGVGSAHYDELRVKLPGEALITLYTDGLVERRERDLDSGIDELASHIQAGRFRVSEVPAKLVEALAPEGTEDDIAILVAGIGSQAVQKTATLDVPATPAAVGEARRFAVSTFRGWLLPDDLIQDGALIATELVTNAILHAQPPIRLRLRRTARELAIEVDDAGSAMPRKLRAGPDDLHGRGLDIVAQLSSRWAARPDGYGKTVWSTLAIREPAPAMAGRVGESEASG